MNAFVTALVPLGSLTREKTCSACYRRQTPLVLRGYAIEDPRPAPWAPMAGMACIKRLPCVFNIARLGSPGLIKSTFSV
jgi:hypothetical protein